MHREARVLQDRVEIAPVGRRRIEAQERIGGGEREQQEAEADQAQHARARAPRSAAAAAPRRSPPPRSTAPAARSTAAASLRARPTAPSRDRRAAARSWNSPRRTRTEKSLPTKAAHQAGERGRHHHELAGDRRGHRRHPALAPERRTGDAEEGLQRREQQREDQGEVTELGQHVRFPDRLGAPRRWPPHRPARRATRPGASSASLRDLGRHVFLVVLGEHLVGDEGAVGCAGWPCATTPAPSRNRSGSTLV